ncbi:MAG: methyltransferase domain-containing protein [Planctomycetota bacterium]
MPDFSRRDIIGEVMDQPGLPVEQHRKALRALRRINQLSCTTLQLARTIARLVPNDPNRTLRILDIASGGGDLAIGLARYAKRRGLGWSITGSDISPTAMDHATSAAKRAGVDVSFVQADALAGLPGAYDMVVCTLFLHHLTDEQIVKLLSQASRAQHIVVSDLRRGRFAYAVTWLGTRLVTRSPIVHVDGPRSVRAALTPGELGALAQDAGLVGARVRRQWPMRMMLTWTAP